MDAFQNCHIWLVTASVREIHVVVADSNKVKCEGFDTYVNSYYIVLGAVFLNSHVILAPDPLKQWRLDGQEATCVASYATASALPNLLLAELSYFLKF